MVLRRCQRHRHQSDSLIISQYLHALNFGIFASVTCNLVFALTPTMTVCQALDKLNPLRLVADLPEEFDRHHRGITKSQPLKAAIARQNIIRSPVFC